MTDKYDPNDFRAELIGRTIPDMAGTEPRLSNYALDRLAEANTHRPKLWKCPDCHVRCRIENAPNHADTCEPLRRAAANTLQLLTREEVQAITAIVREADQVFTKSGGTSRHWVSECFLPLLYQSGWRLGYVGRVSVSAHSGIAGPMSPAKKENSQPDSPDQTGRTPV